MALLPSCTNGGGSSGTSGPPALPNSSLELLLGQRVLLGKPGANDVYVFDVSGDGIRDLIEASPFSGGLVVGTGLSSEEFATTQDVPTPGTPISLAGGDFTGDGIGDVAVLSLLGGAPNAGNPLSRMEDPPTAFLGASVRVTVYTWNDALPVAGQGTPDPDDDVFGGLEQYGEEQVLPGYALTLAAGNLGHARDSLLVPSPFDRKVFVLRDDGAGFAIVDALDSFGPTGVNAPISALVIDADGDGFNDVLSGDVAYDGVSPGVIGLHRQNADGSFEAPTYDLPSPSVPLLSFGGDLDGDGIEDVAALDLSAAGSEVQFFRTDSLGVLVDAGKIVAPARVSVIKVTDLEGDGQREAVIGLLDLGELIVMPISGEGKSIIDDLIRYELGPIPRSIDITTLGPDDGLLDITAGHALGLSLIQNEPAEGVRASVAYSVPDDSQFLRAADLDQDGYTDVVTVDLFQRSVAFLRGLEDGTFEFAGEVDLEPTADETPGSLALDDFDGDGDLDVAIAVFEADEVRILRNDGVLPFSAPAAEDVIEVLDEPIGIATGDVDGDGDVDMLVTLAGARAFSVLLNGGGLASEGEAGFTVGSTVSTGGERPLAAILVDLDGDGDLDGALSFGEETGTGAGFAALEGDGAGNLAVGNLVLLPFIATELQSADLDGKAPLEVVANQVAPTATVIQILTSDGGLDEYTNVEVQSGSPEKFEFEPASILIGDGDADGDDDLAVLTATGRPVLLENQGDIGFVESPVLPGNLGSASIPFGVRHAQIVVSEQAGEGGIFSAELFMLAPTTSNLWYARARLVPKAQN